MYLHFGHAQHVQGVIQTIAIMRQRSTVNDDPIHGIIHACVKPVHEGSFVIGLEVRKRNISISSDQVLHNGLQRQVSIYLRLAFAEKVEVGAIEDKDSFHSC